MTWLLLAGGAALFYAFQGAWTKRITGPLPRFTVAWATFAFAFPGLAAYAGVRGVPSVEPVFWVAVGVNVALLVLSTYLFVSALEMGELGVIYPLLALTPVLVLPVEWLLLSDRPPARGLAGVLLAGAGVYLLNFRPGVRSFLEPFRALARDPAARRMLVVTVVWGITGTVDRVAVLNSSPSFYGAVETAALGLAFLPFMYLRGQGLSAALAPGSRGKLAVLGLIFAAMFICQMEALRLSLASYVLTIKRTGTLLSVLLGWSMFGEERLSWKLGGTSVILAGVLLVATA